MTQIEAIKEKAKTLIKKEADKLAVNYNSTDVYNIAYKGIREIAELNDIREIEETYFKTLKSFDDLKLEKQKREYFWKLSDLGKEVSESGLKGNQEFEKTLYFGLVRIEECNDIKLIKNVYLDEVEKIEFFRLENLRDYYIEVLYEISKNYDFPLDETIEKLMNCSRQEDMAKIVSDVESVRNFLLLNVEDAKSIVKNKLLENAKSIMNSSNAIKLFEIIETAFSSIDKTEDNSVLLDIECKNISLINEFDKKDVDIKKKN